MDKLYGLCHLPLIPLRLSAAHQSEMISQLIFGEIYSIIQSEENWLKIKLENDGYEGWIDKNQYLEITTLVIQDIIKQKIYYTSSAITEAFYPAKEENIYLPFGAALFNFESGVFSFNTSIFEIKNGTSVLPDKKKFNDNIENLARLFLNVPYLWGGKTHLGIDCSGFMQQIFKIAGIQLPRDAWQQALEGKVVDFLETAQLGDLAFFDNAEGKITHVGMLLNKNQIIHASAKVKINTIDNYGILTERLDNYSHKLRIIKRIVFD